MHIENLLSAQRVRQILGISDTTELNMRERGTLPAPLRIGKRNYYIRQDLEASLGLASLGDEGAGDE
jgi:predicted DNA-binding transcriptional regulator AlpA